MTPSTFAALRRLALFACALVAGGALSADPAPMTSQLVTTGLYLIEGGGANTLMRFTANGLIVVDGKSPGRYRDLMSQIRRIDKIADLPVRALILTSADPSKSGNLAEFTAAKVPVVAHESTRRALEGRTGEPPPRFVSFDDKYSIRMGGVDVEVMHLRSANRLGDTIVDFPNLKVVAVGELCDPSDATDAAARAAAIGDVLALDFEKAVPARGTPLSRAAVAALKARLDNLNSRAGAK
jgi:glyoxylase-like metal-dependent hydrolase (beta-lactamase superfamily II)